MLTILQQHRNDAGLLHRENDSPAVIDGQGNQFWFSNGKLHRENGPAAIITSDIDVSNRSYWLFEEKGLAIPTKPGSYWLCEGKLHRDNGPAVEMISGRKEWAIDGKVTRIETPETQEMKKYSKGKQLVELLKTGARAVASGKLLASGEMTEKRLRTCLDCADFNAPICHICGCNMNTKARVEAANCPRDKWDK